MSSLHVDLKNIGMLRMTSFWITAVRLHFLNPLETVKFTETSFPNLWSIHKSCVIQENMCWNIFSYQSIFPTHHLYCAYQLKCTNNHGLFSLETNPVPKLAWKTALHFRRFTYISNVSKASYKHFLLTTMGYKMVSMLLSSYEF